MNILDIVYGRRGGMGSGGGMDEEAYIEMAQREGYPWSVTETVEAEDVKKVSFNYFDKEPICTITETTGDYPSFIEIYKISDTIYNRTNLNDLKVGYVLDKEYALLQPSDSGVAASQDDSNAYILKDIVYFVYNSITITADDDETVTLAPGFYACKKYYNNPYGSLCKWGYPVSISGSKLTVISEHEEIKNGYIDTKYFGNKEFGDVLANNGQGWHYQYTVPDSGAKKSKVIMDYEKQKPDASIQESYNEHFYRIAAPLSSLNLLEGAELVYETRDSSWKNITESFTISIDNNIEMGKTVLGSMPIDTLFSAYEYIILLNIPEPYYDEIELSSGDITKISLQPGLYYINMQYYGTDIFKLTSIEATTECFSIGDLIINEVKPINKKFYDEANFGGKLNELNALYGQGAKLETEVIPFDKSLIYVGDADYGEIQSISVGSYNLDFGYFPCTLTEEDMLNATLDIDANKIDKNIFKNIEGLDFPKKTVQELLLLNSDDNIYASYATENHDIICISLGFFPLFTLSNADEQEVDIQEGLSLNIKPGITVFAIESYIRSVSQYAVEEELNEMRFINYYYLNLHKRLIQIPKHNEEVYDKIHYKYLPLDANGVGYTEDTGYVTDTYDLTDFDWAHTSPPFDIRQSTSGTAQNVYYIGDILQDYDENLFSTNKISINIKFKNIDSTTSTSSPHFNKWYESYTNNKIYYYSSIYADGSSWYILVVLEDFTPSSDNYLYTKYSGRTFKRGVYLSNNVVKITSNKGIINQNQYVVHKIDSKFLQDEFTDEDIAALFDEDEYIFDESTLV